MTKIPMIPGGDTKTEPAKPGTGGKPPQKSGPDKGAPVDHKGAVQKMHPEHVHKLVQDAHAGKFGPEAQKTAQSAMQQAPQAPGAPEEGQQGEPNYAGMFGGGGGQDQDQDDQPVPAGQMFGGR